MDKNEPSEAAMLAALVTKGAEFEGAYASVQRSHRFPFDIFVQIENLAEMGSVSISLIINQLLRCGLESVKTKLPPDAVHRIQLIKQQQSERTTKPLKESSRKTRGKTEPLTSR